MYRCKLLFITALLACSLPVSFSLAQPVDADPSEESSLPTLQLQTQRVVVFKDGYCLVVKEATGTTDANGNLITNDVPDAAVLGSFWAIPQQGELKSMVSGWVDQEDTQQFETECGETIELVAANVGATCDLTIGENTKLSGTILKVLGPAVQQAAPQALSRLMEVESTHSARFATVQTQTTTRQLGSKFLLRMDAGDVMIDANEVRLLTIHNMRTRLSRQVTRKQKTKQLRFEFKQASAEVKMLVMYFRPGMRWIPTYRVDLAAADGDGQTSGTAAATKAGGMHKTVRMALQAEIINEAEDLTNVPIDIVVGVPNFRFRDTPSPLVLESVLRNTLIQASPQLSQQAIGNNRIMFNNYASNGDFQADSFDAEPATVVNLPPELTTKSGNDLFVYSLEPMTLRKGDRATVPIVSSDVPYRDVYTWDVLVKHSESTAETSVGQSPLVLSKNTVWRQIELVNTSGLPWTAGAAMIVDGFQPLAQELLTYTSPGSRCRIPVTIAVDVQGRVGDQEVGRKLDVLRFGNHAYTRVDGQLRPQVLNGKQEPIDLEVSLRFGGKGDEASDMGKIVSSHFRSEDWDHYRGDPAVNNSSRVGWEVTIEPGKQFTPTVEYHFYSRH